MSESPQNNVRVYFGDPRYIELSTFDLQGVKSEELKKEIKEYLKSVTTELDMSKKNNRKTYIYPIRYLIEYFSYKDILTIKDISEEAIRKYEDFLMEIGIEDGHRDKTNRASNNQKIIWRVIRYTLISSSEKEQFTYDRWLIDKQNVYLGNNSGIVSFAGLPENIKNDLKSFLIQCEERLTQKNTFKSLVLYPIRLLIDYCIDYEINEITEITIDEYKIYLEKNDREIYKSESNRKKIGPNVNILNLLWIFQDEKINPFFYDRDFWDLTKLKIEESRLSLIDLRESISFRGITNGKNKKLQQVYIRHLIEDTSLTLSTILRKHYMIRRIMINFKNGIEQVPREEIIIFIKEEYGEKMQGSILNDLKDMFFYLYETSNIDDPILYQTDLIKRNKKHVNRTVDEYIVNQIFNILDRIPDDLMLIYLIIYCTGVRISEALTIKSDALFTNSKGCLLRTYSTKMKKEQFSAIPIELYVMIDSYIKEKCYESNVEYVFKSKRNPELPMKSGYFREKIHKQFEDHEIKSSTGENYRIDIHGYRHRLGTEMHEHRISLFIIQKALHHESVQMTIAYIDILEKDIKESYKDFFDKNGDKIVPDPKSERVVIILNYLDKAFNMQALPNGICTLPVKLGKCAHANACLTCNHFGTNANYLDILRQQLIETDHILEESYKNDWIMQIATNEEVKKNLENLIAKLGG
ncbi:site-specific recombinase XerD [Paenibacillus taihuensis]|uniref:Site-specific recombinase XerD n=1 Tax=Paenibacillus taihuensis TaxID=1156355 RepID=A0A3D9S7R4_9BACL|nr:tyrosine-type recombinase/integrase [Paenibacillus taihuensis]REE84572.1 site-specific recombinase XerD [Paenibacillus taihuensis]